MDDMDGETASIMAYHLCGEWPADVAGPGRVTRQRNSTVPEHTRGSSHGKHRKACRRDGGGGAVRRAGGGTAGAGRHARLRDLRGHRLHHRLATDAELLIHVGASGPG